MNYIRTEADGQLTITQSTDYLFLPSCLYGFHNTETSVKTAESGRTVYCYQGYMDIPENERICSCGRRMHVNNHPDIYIRHLPFGSNLTTIKLPHNQLRCPACNATKAQFISFKADNHRITNELYTYARELLASNNYTNKEVADITGLGKNVVKDIDKERLMDKYTIKGELRKPEKQSIFLGIDEFKLHKGHRFATHILDLETGHVLWIQNGKKKQVVYDFIEHVGLEWMSHVEAVACDMNSDFQEAFEERCPHIQIVFDHFHIIKNFNDNVVSEIRKDEQRRLIAEGDENAARLLKGSKYILTSSRSELRRKDEEAQNGKVIKHGTELFKTPDILRKGGNEARYDELIKANKLLLTCDIVKEKLRLAYSQTEQTWMSMGTAIADIVYVCMATNNKHFEWFGRLLMNHHAGIVGYEKYHISTGKMEGTNRKIKTIRSMGYGYPDDEYFFLKIIDASRQEYIRNPKSHRIYD